MSSKSELTFDTLSFRLFDLKIFLKSPFFAFLDFIAFLEIS